MAEVYIAKESAVVNVDGVPQRIRKNATRVSEGHPLLQEHGGLFRLAEGNFGVRNARSEPSEPSAPADDSGEGSDDDAAPKKTSRKR